MAIQVLVVDDESTMLEITKSYLEKDPDIKVDTAESVSDALKMLDSKKYDAIVSDFQMEGASGIDFLKTVRSRGDKTPFIIFTGKGREEVVIEALNCGVDSYMQKGGKPDAQFAELKNKIKKHVQRNRAEQELAQTEKALREESQILSDVFASIQDGICVLDKDLTVLRENPAMQKIYPPINPPVIGQKCYYTYDNRTSRCPDCHAWRAIEKGEIVRETVYRKNPDGLSEKWMDIFHFPMIDRDTKAVRGVILYLRDVSERRLSEKALEEGDHFVAQVFSSIQDGISVLDKDLNIVRVNPAMERWYAHALPIVGKKCYEAYHGRSSPCEICPTIRTLETGLPEYDVVPLTGHDGKIEGWLDLYSFPLKNPNTVEIEGVIEYVRDATDRMKALEALNREHQQILSIFDSIDEIIYVADPVTHELLFINQALRDEFGDIIGKKCYEALQGLNSPCSFCTNTKIFSDNTGQPYVWEFQNRITKRWYRCIDRAILWPDGRLVRYEMAVDINDLKKAEESLQQANEMLGLVGSVTKHDILNKLTSILNLADIAVKKTDDREIKEYLKNIKESGDSIKKQLDFVAKYWSQGVKSPEWLKLDEVLAKSISEMDLSKIIVNLDVDAFEIFANPMLQKVFDNLFDNALRHGKNVTRIDISAKEQDDGLKIYFEDNGSGISPYLKKLLFEAQFNDRTTHGLYFISQILANTGIKIEEVGQEKQGARFVISVPGGKYRLRMVSYR